MRYWSSLPGPPIAVDPQRGSMTHLPPATTRQHHQCYGNTALAACPRMCAVQGCSHDIQSTAQQQPETLKPLVTFADLPSQRDSWSASTSHLILPPMKVSTIGTNQLRQLKSGMVCHHVIVITADFPPSIKNLSSTFIPTSDFLTA